MKVTTNRDPPEIEDWDTDTESGDTEGREFSSFFTVLAVSVPSRGAVVENGFIKSFCKILHRITFNLSGTKTIYINRLPQLNHWENYMGLYS